MRQKERRGREHPCPIVAIGASAGGLEDFRTFFARMPADNGMAFILVQHLSPHHETLMPELVAKETPMPVQLVADDMVVERNHVYVTPPDTLLTIEDCVLRVSQPSRTYGRRTPIDSFLRSLAEDQGDEAVAVILSGHGTDGALGAKAIQEHGGLVLVRAPESSRFDGMPQSAIARGAADYVLEVEDMPAKLLEHCGSYSSPKGFREDIGEHLGRICSILRRNTGHDFSRYKQSTLIRRLRRRIHELRAESVEAYLERLLQDSKEVDQLFQDLLIGVTHFFRDPEAFEVLERKVISRLFDRDPDEPVRVWVAGCATGEEAYSLAILLREHASRLDNASPVQLFATDIDEQALETARLALYPEGIAAQISPERLERFFVRHGNMYQVAKEVREICLFSTHNLIADPPFSRLDLLSCRNLLIYLQSELQKKLVPLCHYALRSGGFLFLGPSESVAGYPELFRHVDKKHRVFKRREAVIRPPVSLTLMGRNRLPSRLYVDERRGAVEEKDVARTFERILLEQYSPACVVVNDGGDIVYFSPRTGKYLEQPPGRPSLNVLDMARKGLKLDLRTALHKAANMREPVVQEDVRFEAGGQVVRLDLSVRPMLELGEDAGLFMIVFQELPDGLASRPLLAGAGGGPGTVPGAAGVDAVADAQGEIIRRMEIELRGTRDHLQATLEELESSNEELVSSNEELLSINEELQSANEELQTSKEELQSVNEELETVNTELKKKIEELNRAHSDLQNLFESTRIATIFVDRDLRIQRFTPAATEVFRLIGGDLGRPITDISPRFGDADLVADVKEVLRTLTPRERPVRLTQEEAWYQLRILPYRTVDDVIDGVVMTFVNVTDVKRAQERSAQLAAIVESSHDAIIGRDVDGTITSWNSAAERMMGYPAQEALGRPISFPVPPDRLDELPAAFEKLRQGLRVEPFETVRMRKDGSRVNILLSISPVLDEDGQVVAFSSIDRDVDERLRAREELRRSEERYRSLVAAMTSVVWTTDEDGNFVIPQFAWESYTGQSWEQHQGWGWLDAIHPGDRERIREAWSRSLQSHALFQVEERIWHAASGRFRHATGRALPLLNADGTLREWVGTVTDMDDQKRAEQELRQAARRKDEFLAILGHELRNPLGPIRNCLHMLNLPEVTAEQSGKARQTVERQVLHLTRLVDDLLDISRISQGKILLRKEPVDLTELVRTTLEDHRGILEEAGLRLRLDLPPAPVWTAGDPTRLSQALGNILHNAGKFTDRGGVVAVRLRPVPGPGGGRLAELRVSDTGVGIPPEVLGHLFEPFSQAGRPNERGGLGLGLALVKSLIELHGGKVEAHSAGPGKGAEIVVRLPLEVAAPAPAAASPLQEIAPAGRGRRCLLIEDNLDAAESMSLLLELDGHEVALAHDGPSGVATARRFRPEAVLCDIGLPGDMDGYGVARALRAEPGLGLAYLIALTGYGQEEDQRRAREAGFDAHMTKPADPEALRRLLRDLPERTEESSNWDRDRQPTESV